jgi:hypothetical protein
LSSHLKLEAGELPLRSGLVVQNWAAFWQNLRSPRSKRRVVKHGRPRRLGCGRGLEQTLQGLLQPEAKRVPDEEYHYLARRLRKASAVMPVPNKARVAGSGVLAGSGLGASAKKLLEVPVTPGPTVALPVEILSVSTA